MRQEYIMVDGEILPADFPILARLVNWWHHRHDRTAIITGVACNGYTARIIRTQAGYQAFHVRNPAGQLEHWAGRITAPDPVKLCIRFYKIFG